MKLRWQIAGFMGAVVVSTSLIAGALAPAGQASSTSSQQKGNAPSKAAPKKAEVSEGQRIFDENCSRCHNAPDGFSSRISGTVVRHMRVRANLSEHDEQELLKFFNP